MALILCPVSASDPSDAIPYCGWRAPEDIRQLIALTDALSGSSDWFIPGISPENLFILIRILPPFALIRAADR